MRPKSPLACVLTLCCLLAACVVSHSAEDELLWRIGDCDNSYSEFAIARDHGRYPQAFAGGVRFEVGKSEPRQDWPFIQPGPVDAWAGSTQHPQQIAFDMDREIDGICVLQVDLVDAHAGYPPTLSVRINDASQSFQLRPGVSDVSLSDPANGREQVVRMYVRGSSLKKGSNQITLTLTSGSWALYDCISFSKCGAPPKAVENLSFGPTFLFKRGDDGGVRQVVSAWMDLFEAQGLVRAELTGEQGLRVIQEFTDVPAGRSQVEIEVPEVKQTEKAHLKVTVGSEVYEADGSVAPRKRWRIYLLSSTHLDIGYTDRQDRSMKVHRESMDRAMGWMEKYPGFVWNAEGSLAAEDYLEKGPNPRKMLELAKKGRVGVLGFYGNELTGICSSEGLVRLVDYYDYLRHEYGIESGCAMMSDVPTMVATVPMILAGHGIKYLSHGVNATRARPDQEFYNTPYYWESPDGSRVLTWRAPGYGYTSQITGTGDQYGLQDAGRRINEILAEYVSRKDYPFDAILMHGGYGDNQPNGEAMASIPDQWNRMYEYPKLIFTRGPDFFEHIERNFKKDLKTVKGDGGVWWEDGAGSSAHETAITRIAKEKLITAEKLAALCGKKQQKSLAATLAKAWRNVLYYDEHTWGAAQSISDPNSQQTREQWEIKKQFADGAAESADKAFVKAAADYVAGIRASADSVVVFNPSSCTRTETVDFAGPDGTTLSLSADSVPPLGYRLYPANKARPDTGKSLGGDGIENQFYRVEFDKATGAVKSIYDKELRRELVDSTASSGLNAYLYVTGGEDPKVLNFDASDRVPQLKSAACSAPTFRKVKTAFGQTMKIECSAPMASDCSVTVTLPDNRKAILFSTHLDKTANLAKEAGYVAFPFAFKNPQIRIEIPDGVIRPEIDQTKAACRDWYAVQSFLTVSDDAASVALTPVESPLVTLQDINRGQWYDHIKIENGHVFAYLFNNYWFTNYKASQDGALTFRFAMTSAKKITDAEAKRFGESIQNPMITVFVKGTKGAPSPKSRSYVRVKDDNVVVQALKPARFTNGTVIRLREMSGKTCKARVTIDGIPFKRAYLCNLAEDKLSPLAVRKSSIEVPCRALGLATVLLEP